LAGQIEFPRLIEPFGKFHGPGCVKGLQPHAANYINLSRWNQMKADEGGTRLAWWKRACAGAAAASMPRWLIRLRNAPVFTPAVVMLWRGKEGWQKKHNPEAAGPVRTMSSPYDLISRKILF
jgi:hypothetical protein